jgi:hypothetical protein
VAIEQFEQPFNLMYYQTVPTLCDIRDLYRVADEDPVFGIWSCVAWLTDLDLSKRYIAIFFKD